MEGMISRCHLKKNQALPKYLSVKVLPEMPETLSGLIQRRMIDVGINSKSEFARRMGISPTYAGDLINGTGKTKSGTYTPSPEMVEKLSKVLQITENEVLQAVGYNIFDDELVAEGLFDGYYELSEQRRALARKQIAAIIRILREEEFKD